MFIIKKDVGIFFGKNVTNYLGIKHIIGVLPGIDALLIKSMALGIGNGNAVIFQLITFFPKVRSIVNVEAIIVLLT